MDAVSLKATFTQGDNTAPKYLEALLAPDMVRYRVEGREVVLDFRLRRRYEIDQAGAVSDLSLFSDIGFRDVELPNREHIRGVMAAGGAKEATEFSPLRSEHNLGITRSTLRADPIQTTLVEGTGAGDRQISMQRNAATTSYQCGARRLFEHSNDGYACDPALLRRFVQLLKYRFGGHPLILDQMQQSGLIPRDLRYFSFVPTKAETDAPSLQVTSCEPAAPMPMSLVGLSPKAPDAASDAIDRALFCVSQTAPLTEVDVQQRLDGAIDALTGGNALHGVLAFVGLTFESTAGGSPALVNALRGLRDPNAKAVLSVATRPPRDATEARDAIEVCESTRRHAGAWAYVVMTLEANLRCGFGERREAIALLTDAIAANPHHAGGLKDLADLLLAAYDMRRAWQCWDEARRLCPNHPLLAGVTEREEALVAAHPGYF